MEDHVISISEWIAHALADTGCKNVYGGHGGALVPLVNAIVKHPELTWVYGRTEHDAATMAAADAKMTGNLGVVIATSGPGATGLTTGLLEAVMDRVPLLAITGMKPTAQLGYAEFQDLNQSRLFAGGGIDWSKSVSSANAAIPLLRDAVATALTQRTCVHLAIPVDIQAAQSPLPIKNFCASHANLRIQAPAVDPFVLDSAARFLVGTAGQGYPRIVIAAGLRAVPTDGTTDMSKIILDLAEALNAPVLTRLHAKGVVDEYHPLSFGVIGVHGKPGLRSAAALISSADCVIAIGVEDETLLACNMAGLQIRDVIEIEPDAMSVSTRFNAEATLIGDVGETCKQLTARVEALVKARQAEARKPRRSISRSRQSMDPEQLKSMWDYMVHGNPDIIEVERETSMGGSASGRGHQRQLSLSVIERDNAKDLLEDTDALWQKIHSKKWKALLATQEKEHSPRFEVTTCGSEKSYCHPAALLKALSLARLDESVDKVARDAAITVDVGDVTLWASLCLSLTGGSRTLYSERLGTMGYALCAAIAAILAKPGPAAAVCLAGDGGFQMSLQELATFQQMKRPGDKLICIVLDNSVLGRVAFGFENAGGCEVLGPDYVALAKAYGGDGVRLDCSEDADAVVRQALSSEGLFMIHVMVDPAVKADMAKFHDNSLEVMNSG